MKTPEISALCVGCPNWQNDGSCPDVPADSQAERAAKLAEANAIRPGRDPKFFCFTRGRMRTLDEDVLFRAGLKLIVNDPANRGRLFGK